MKNYWYVFSSVRRAKFCCQKYIDLISNKRNGIYIRVPVFILKNILHKKYSIIIGSCAQVGTGIVLPHPQCIVIGSNVVIGNNCIIYHDVTIGQNKGEYPRIGDNVIIYPGAKIIGDVFVGDYAIIGANAVVTKNVSDREIVAGVPAKRIGMRNIDEDEFY